MIAVSPNFTARRRSGQYRLEQLYELFLPVNPMSVTASSATAGFPASAVIDGDRTHINAGVFTGANYPPPAGPENLIGGGVWKASAAVPQSVTLDAGGASVGMVRLYTHPTDGGIRTFKLQTAAVLGGPYTDVTGILRVNAWEKWNGPSIAGSGASAFYFQDFEPLTLGDLNGKDSWVKVQGDATFTMQVENTDVLAGTQSLACIRTGPIGAGIEPVYRRLLTIPSAYTATMIARPLSGSAVGPDMGVYSTDNLIAPAPAWAVAYREPSGVPKVFWFLNTHVAGVPAFTQIVSSGPHTVGVDVNGTAISFLVDGAVVFTGTFTPGIMDRIMLHYSPAVLGTNGVLDNILFQVPSPGSLTVTPSNVNIASVPSVIEVVLNPSISANFLRVLVADAGPTPASDGLARLCEVEMYRRVDVTNRLSAFDVSHSTDIRMQGINARQGNMEMKNQDLAFTPADFQRPTTGQGSVDAVPEVHVYWGIDGESIRVCTLAVDEAQFGHKNRSLGLRVRGRSERAMFDKLIGAYRTNVDLDECVELAWNLCNLPSGLLATERNPNLFPYFIPGEAGRLELEDLRKASVDRGAFVKNDATLGTMANTFASDIPMTTTGTNPGHPGVPFIVAYRQDALFFDPVNPYLVIYPERTFQTIGAQNNLTDTDADRLTVWDVRKPIGTRTLLAYVFNRASTAPTKTYLDRIFSVPSVMAQHPGTNDFYFLCGGAYPQVASVQGPPAQWNIQDGQPPWLMSAYTIVNGVATPLFVNRAISHEAECAAFVGNTLYWWDAPYALDGVGNIQSGQLRTARLWKWDVTTAYVPVLVGTTAANVRQVGGMVAVGTKLYWTENNTSDGRIAVWDTTTAWATAATFAQPYGVWPGFPSAPARSPLQIRTDGTSLWGTGQFTPMNFASSGIAAKLWRVDLATATVSLTLNETSVCGGMILSGGLALVLGSSGYGYLGLQTWDGVNGTNPVLVSISSIADSTFLQTVAHRALAISPVTFYGKRIVAGWANGIGTPFTIHSNPGGGAYTVQSAGTIRSNFTLWSYRTATAPVVDTINTGQVLEVSENISYELGGASAVVNAVDGEILSRGIQAGAVVYQEPAGGNTSAHLVVLTDTVNPLTLTGAIRQHARFPLGAGGTLIGTVAAEASGTFRLPSPFMTQQTQDPSVLNVVEIAGKYFITACLGYNAALRVLSEASQALRWPTLEMPIFPEVELNDEVTISIIQRTNAASIVITGRYRVTMVNHRVSVGDTDAEARTTLELVSIP